MPPIYDDYNDSYFVKFAPTTINENYYACVESNNNFMHVDHDNNVLCDRYIVEFIHDSTESYYERGKYGCENFHVTKTPLFMLNFLKLHLFCFPMLVTLCFIDLFLYKIILHRKWVRLKCVSYLLLDALLLCFNSYSYVSIFKNHYVPS